MMMTMIMMMLVIVVAVVFEDLEMDDCQKHMDWLGVLGLRKSRVVAYTHS